MACLFSQASSSREEASVIDVLIYPEKYAGKKIIMSGYLPYSMDYLYLTKVYAQLGSSRLRAAIWDINTQTFTDCRNNYVTLVATFERDKIGRFSLTDIEEIEIVDIDSLQRRWRFCYKKEGFDKKPNAPRVPILPKESLNN